MLHVFQTLLQLPRFHGVPLNDTLLQWCSSTSIGQHHFYHQTLDIVGICSQYQHRNRFVCLTHFLCFSHTKSKFYFSKAVKPNISPLPEILGYVLVLFCFLSRHGALSKVGCVPKSHFQSRWTQASLSFPSFQHLHRRGAKEEHYLEVLSNKERIGYIQIFKRAFVWYIVLVGCGGRPMGCEKLDSLSCQRFYSRLLPVFVCSPFPLTPPFSPSYLPYTRHNWLMLSSWLFLQSHRSWCVFDKWKW